MTTAGNIDVKLDELDLRGWKLLFRNILDDRDAGLFTKTAVTNWLEWIRNTEDAIDQMYNTADDLMEVEGRIIEAMKLKGAAKEVQERTVASLLEATEPVLRTYFKKKGKKI